MSYYIGPLLEVERVAQLIHITCPSGARVLFVYGALRLIIRKQHPSS